MPGLRTFMSLAMLHRRFGHQFICVNKYFLTKVLYELPEMMIDRDRIENEVRTVATDIFVMWSLNDEPHISGNGAVEALPVQTHQTDGVQYNQTYGLDIAMEITWLCNLELPVRSNIGQRNELYRDYGSLYNVSCC